MAQIQPPETFDFSTPNEWPKWRKRFERYLVVSGMKKKEEADKIDLFMYLMGDRADDIFRTFKFEKEEEATKIGSVLKAFDSHFCVRKNIIYERAKFNSRIQEDREPVDEFITSLYKLADSCEFEGLHEQLIRDRIVVGVRDKALSERMQLDSELTLEKAVKMVRQQEAVRQQQVDLQRPSTSQKVNQVKFNSKKQSPKQQQQPSRKKDKSAKTRSRCPKCGGFTHREGQACRAEGQKCNLCSKTGHFANCCPDKQAKTAEVKAVSELDEEIGFLLEVSAVEDSSNLDDDEDECRRRWTAEIQVNGKKVKFKLDSQANVTCVPLCLFKKIMGQQRLVKSDINLRAAEFSELQTVGMFISTLRNGNYEIKEKIYVIRRLSEPLLSRRACELLNLARRIEVVATRINPIKEFPEVFEGLGQIGNPYEIKLKPGAKPYAVHTPRRVPIPLMEKLKTRLEELEMAGIIAQVNVATEWCAPTVIAGKPNGDIRLCVDLSRLNEHVQREVHPMPVVEHMLGQLGEARFFSKLDANSGFHQIPLSPDCQHLTTFITPFGRYKYCRMPFGISLAPEYFQRIMSIISAEAGVKIAKLILKKNQDPSLGLLEYRSTPLENGYSPAELLMGRKLRTTLPIAPENLNPKLVDSQTLKRKEGRRRKDMKSRYDRRCGATDMEELSEGDTMDVRKVILVAVTVLAVHSCPPAPVELPGDVHLAALLNVHEPSGLLSCGTVSRPGLELWEGLRWAVGLLNQPLIPGVTFGLRALDGCGHPAMSLHHLSQLFPDVDSCPASSDMHNVTTAPFPIGVLDATGTTSQPNVADKIHRWSLPLVPLDPSNAVPPEYLAKILMEVAHDLEWRRVALLHADDEYSVRVVKTLGEIAPSSRLCIQGLGRLSATGDLQRTLARVTAPLLNRTGVLVIAPEVLSRTSRVIPAIHAVLTLGHAYHKAWKDKCNSQVGLCSELNAMSRRDFLQQYLDPLEFQHMEGISPPEVTGRKSRKSGLGEIEDMKLSLTSYSFSNGIVVFNQMDVRKVILVAVTVLAVHSCPPAPVELPGDVHLAALLNVHEPSGLLSCGTVSRPGLELWEGLRWAVGLLNQPLIPGVTFGLRALDGCGHPAMSLHHLSQLFPDVDSCPASSDMHNVTTAPFPIGVLDATGTTSQPNVADKIHRWSLPLVPLDPSNAVPPEYLAKAILDLFKGYPPVCAHHFVDSSHG
ncbi:hypothetical protein LAZ67_2004456 [Cordylochernes scorpioides]|uniref:Reverse transcriptase domain-containing protein n=1 Tax=Cordylochernes scorpioides TaxID=51811 RepID=A0ABY6K3S6_9ARAC|nr:hypothetical protein LAZ67_2004456 [Cordylochernes scorpioides]